MTDGERSVSHFGVPTWETETQSNLHCETPHIIEGSANRPRKTLC